MINIGLFSMKIDRPDPGQNYACALWLNLKWATIFSEATDAQSRNSTKFNDDKKIIQFISEKLITSYDNLDSLSQLYCYMYKCIARFHMCYPMFVDLACSQSSVLLTGGLQVLYFFNLSVEYVMRYGTEFEKWQQCREKVLS